MTTSTYRLDNSWDKARQRLEGLEAMSDRGTIRHLEELGVGAGWNCLEAGAGGGSITRWLADRVAPDGRVLAVDINTRFVDDLRKPNLEVRRHDLIEDELPAESFDLVHTRAVIGHLPDRHRALDNLMTALAPEGVLLAEEMDFVAAAPVPGVDPGQADVFNTLLEAHHRVLNGRFDVYYGRRVVRDLERLGLEDVEAEGRTVIVRGGTPGAMAWQLTFEQLSESMLDAGLVTQQEIIDVMDVLDDPAFAFQSMVFVAAWGRKPAA
jgi:SAM-dependent methyltransferase